MRDLALFSRRQSVSEEGILYLGVGKRTRTPMLLLFVPAIFGLSIESARYLFGLIAVLLRSVSDGFLARIAFLLDLFLQKFFPRNYGVALRGLLLGNRGCN